MVRSGTFCPLPWSTLAVQPYGVSLCCASKADLRQGQEALFDTFNGARVRAIRQQLLDGEWPVECKDCETKEAGGFVSNRQQWSTGPIYRGVMERAAEIDAEAGKIVFLELAGDNLCNLKCRMCRPQYSSRWQEDVPALRRSAGLLGEWFYEVRPPAEGLGLDPSSPALRSLRMLMLKGGEPMLNKGHLEFLRGLAAGGRARNMTLRMTTNGTIVPAGFLEVMREFEKVELGVSIDGVDPLFQYIRSGRFTAADVKRNLDTLRNASMFISVTTAFQIYNMLSYDRLIEEFRPWTRFFSTQFVTSWGLGAGAAPEPLREEAIATLERIPRAGLADFTCERLDLLVKYLRAGRYDPKEWRQFKRLTLELDRIRRESIFDVAPGIGAYLRQE